MMKKITVTISMILVLCLTAGLVSANLEQNTLSNEITAQMGRQMPGGQWQGGRMGGMQGGMTGGAQNVSDTPGEIVFSSIENTAAGLTADLNNAETIVMSSSNAQVEIDEAGTYIVTGSVSDGNITVKKGTDGVVLILQDLDLTSTKGAAVSVNKEASVQIIISGTVTLTDAENAEDEYSADAETADAYDGAALKVKADASVRLTGDGTLNISGTAKNGIKAGDGSSLIIDSLTLNIAAVNDAINSGYDLTILSGALTIRVSDDALHADHILTLGSEDGSGPAVNIISCSEGLEAAVVNILGGDITVNSSDDAINAANKDGLYKDELTYSLNQLGGSVTVSSNGDGYDSNGNINLIGGSAMITSRMNGGEAGVDYDGQYYISDSFSLNNNSGISGPDNFGGGMQGGQGGFGGWGGQMPGGRGGRP